MSDTSHHDPIARPGRFALYEPESNAAPAAGTGWTLQTVVEPNVLFGSNGIRIAPDGTLWITQVNGDQITAWDPRTDTLSIADPMGSPMIGPDDIAFDSTGACYVTETLNNQVSGRRGDDYFVVLDQTTGPNGITIDPATDRLFVDEMSEGGRVLELDRNAKNGVRVIAEGLDWLNALERGPDGRLYLPQVFAGQIAAVDVDTGEVTIVATDMRLPTAVKFDKSGGLVVSEAAAGEITRVDLATGQRTTLARPGPSIDNFCFDADGGLYTSNFVEARVEQWDPATGVKVAVAAPGGLIGPASIAGWDGDTVVVADHNSIIRVGLDGSLGRMTRLLGTQQFVADAAIRVSGVLIALSLAGEVLTIDPPTGATTKLVEIGGSMTEQLLSKDAGGATALAASVDGRVLVGIGGDVVEMAPDGSDRTVHTFGAKRVDAIASAAGTLAIADTAAGTVVVLHDGQLTTIDDLVGPEAVAIFDGSLFVAEVGHRRLRRISLDGARRDTVLDDLPIGMPRESVRLGRHASLYAFDATTLLIGCDGDGSIRSLRRT